MDQHSISELGEPQSFHKHLLNPESLSQSIVRKDHEQFVQSQRMASPGSSSQMPSINAELRSRLAQPESIPHQNPSSEVTNENIIIDGSPAQSVTSVSYLNISFQEIINLLAHNESPTLLSTIRRAIRNSSFLVFALLIFITVALVLETVALYGALISDQNQIDRLMAGFYLLKWLSDALLLYSLLQVRYAINDSAYLGQGEVSSHVIEFLKYIIRTNSPFDEDDSDDEAANETQAQWVARSIATKIDTQSWINYLINYESAHLYSINRVIMISEALLFFWGNAILVQLNSYQTYASLVLFYTMMPGYAIAAALSVSVILICASLPVMIILIIYQWFTYCFQWVSSVQQSVRGWCQRRARRRFLRGLRPLTYSTLKSGNPFQSDDLCVICLAMYNPQENVIQLPCNVSQSQGNATTNHYFHETCILVWIEEQGNCPVCRKRFISLPDEDND